MKKIAKIGIMSEVEWRKRMLLAARGERNRDKNEPKIWFSSMRSLAEVLSDKNRELLRTIATEHPATVSELAQVTGRDKGNLTRTLRRLATYGIVELRKENRNMRPVAKYTEFLIAA